LIILVRGDRVLAIIILFSMLLHAVAFWLIFSLNNKLKKKQSTDIEDITELLDLYLDELREENKQLKEELKENTDLTQVKEAESSHIPFNNPAEQIDDNIETNVENEDFLETSMEAQVLQLHQQKYSANEIARKLNCGKTEVELIIKFHKKNNNNT